MSIVGTLRATPEYRWLLPAALTAELDDHRPMRRSTRDWVIDAICYVLAMSFTVAATIDLLQPHPSFVQQWAGTAPWLVWLDFAGGVLVAAALWWRRRWPVAICLVLTPIGLFAVSTAISGLILMFTVAVHRRFGIVGIVTVINVLANAAFCLIRPERGSSFLESFAQNTVIMVLIVLWGMVIRSRRQLVVSLRDRAERAEAEQQLRVAQARALERTRIAREMHDVLAHRISLLSLHAGALEIRPDAAPAEVAVAAGVIRASAHQALQDLREVIGVLRDDAGDGAPERPQPSLTDLPALIDESRRAGMAVTWENRLHDVAVVPASIGRSAYRTVQESLTNARKHAPGATVRVMVGGAAGTGLTVEVCNPLVKAAPEIPGAGAGLIGLTERAMLAGGRLEHGRTGQGDFRVHAWLPWPA
jgi:signal transduction histidine kinase